MLDHALAALDEKERRRDSAKPRKNLAQFLMESPLNRCRVGRVATFRFANVVRGTGSPARAQAKGRLPSVVDGLLAATLWGTV